ncbi:MAG: Maf family nucleotide pyrophosphatase [Bacteroidota bacterium]|nr:Maf family nucleotide pyrophosphatase [Bacteroidota bacterium]
MQIILASKSPRRQELVSKLAYPVIIDPIDADESFPDNLKAGEIASYLSKKKSDHYHKTINAGDVLLTCDTIVWINNEVMNKPENIEEARQMLQILSGEMHEVYTGVTLKTEKQTITFAEKTEVYFKPLSEVEIDHYINTFKPFDKAGAYGIQEWIGYIGVEKIVGCYYNVMGLPLSRVYGELRRL